MAGKKIEATYPGDSRSRRAVVEDLLFLFATNVDNTVAVRLKATELFAKYSRDFATANSDREKIVFVIGDLNELPVDDELFWDQDDKEPTVQES